MARFRKFLQFDVPRTVSLQHNRGPRKSLEPARVAGFYHHHYRCTWCLWLTAVKAPGAPFAAGNVRK
jgi:hypothetical protein